MKRVSVVLVLLSLFVSAWAAAEWQPLDPITDPGKVNEFARGWRARLIHENTHEIALSDVHLRWTSSGRVTVRKTHYEKPWEWIECLEPDEQRVKATFKIQYMYRVFGTLDKTTYGNRSYAIAYGRNRFGITCEGRQLPGLDSWGTNNVWRQREEIRGPQATEPDATFYFFRALTILKGRTLTYRFLNETEDGRRLDWVSAKVSLFSDSVASLRGHRASSDNVIKVLDFDVQLD